MHIPQERGDALLGGDGEAAAGEDVVAAEGVEDGPGVDEIDLAAKQVFEGGLGPDQVGEGRFGGEFDQHVNVAVGAELLGEDGAEEGEFLDVVLAANIEEGLAGDTQALQDVTGGVEAGLNGGHSSSSAV